jgi:hypothetical protein
MSARIAELEYVIVVDFKREELIQITVNDELKKIGYRRALLANEEPTIDAFVACTALLLRLHASV